MKRGVLALLGECLGLDRGEKRFLIIMPHCLKIGIFKDYENSQFITDCNIVVVLVLGPGFFRKKTGSKLSMCCDKW